MTALILYGIFSDRYSEQANKEIHAVKDLKELEAKKKEILEYFTQVLNKEQDLSGLLIFLF